MAKNIILLLISSLLVSCSDSANDNSHLRQPQQAQTKQKSSFPFTTRDKVDTSKMMKIDYPCAIDNFHNFRNWEDSAKKNNLDLRKVAMSKGLTNNEYYNILEAYLFCENTFFDEMKSAGILLVKKPKNINVYCFVDSLKREYFILSSDLQNKPCAIFFNGRDKPCYYNQVLPPFEKFAKEYFHLK